MGHTTSMQLNEGGASLMGLRRTITIWEYERGVLYSGGRFARVLEPGRYHFWRWEPVRVERVSVRQMSEVLSGQEMLTSDNVEVRLSLVVQYVVSDPAVALNAVESYTTQLYQDVQLSLRSAISGRTLEELLQGRDAINATLLEEVAPRAARYGLTLKRIGVRDLILPGAVRTIFLKEIEADRIGRAELLKARHEVATARTRANTAKILSENPHVVRMQEIEALLTLAEKPGNVVLLPNLASLLAPQQLSMPTSEQE